ncbi:MAG: hypothetical protein V4463_17875 [Pseudomonadota bacterium]
MRWTPGKYRHVRPNCQFGACGDACGIELAAAEGGLGAGGTLKTN